MKRWAAPLIAAPLIVALALPSLSGGVPTNPTSCKKVRKLERPKKPCRGKHWVKGSSRKSARGRLWSRNEHATLLWQLGARPATATRLSQKLLGESGGHPKAHGPPDGRGLLQIEEQFHPELRHLNQWRPIQNSISAIHIYRKQGIGAWYAPSTYPGTIKPKLTR